MFRLQEPLPDTYAHASGEELAAAVTAVKVGLGARLVILGHHYQRDDVISFADSTGDSFGLSRFAAGQHEADYVVFCGVHFMAESADILTGEHQAVLLPDLNAGCSMADMADLDAVEQIWDELAGVTDVTRVVPITYMNSSAALKAFVGRNGGAVCTSSNARSVLSAALGLQGRSPTRDGGESPAWGGGDKVLFFPDQHLGRNTGFELGFAGPDMAVIDPRRPLGGLEERQVKEATVLLWKGHCSVHQRFSTAQVEAFRDEHPGGIVIVHPECSHEVVEVADDVGSTDHIIKAVAAAPAGSVIAVGTEIHLVDRLARRHAGDRKVVSLDPIVCPCSTMSRIDLPHLAWVLDGLGAGEVRNRITVDTKTAAGARIALERMLAVA
ncbi:MAG: quinolinate synthase NadA [Acidimicrobiales bacterium]